MALNNQSLFLTEANFSENLYGHAYTMNLFRFHFLNKFPRYADGTLQDVLHLVGETFASTVVMKSHEKDITVPHLTGLVYALLGKNAMKEESILFPELENNAGFQLKDMHVPAIFQTFILLTAFMIPKINVEDNLINLLYKGISLIPLNKTPEELKLDRNSLRKFIDLLKLVYIEQTPYQTSKEKIDETIENIPKELPTLFEKIYGLSEVVYTLLWNVLKIDKKPISIDIVHLPENTPKNPFKKIGKSIEKYKNFIPLNQGNILCEIKIPKKKLAATAENIELKDIDISISKMHKKLHPVIVIYTEKEKSKYTIVVYSKDKWWILSDTTNPTEINKINAKQLNWILFEVEEEKEKGKEEKEKEKEEKKEEEEEEEE